MRAKVKIILPVLLLAAGYCFPQSTYNFHHVTTSNGLSDGVVRAIGQDKYGYIWIATLSGLNRYNGYTVKQFQNVPGDSLSLPAGLIRSILGDARGNLWIGTNSGLYKFNYENSHFHRVPVSNNISILKMIEVTPDSIFLATNRGLAMFKPNSQEIILYNNPRNAVSRKLLGIPVNDIFLHERTFYIATDSGLIVFNLAAREPRLVQLKPITDKSVNRIAVDGHGNIWASYGYIGELLVKSDSLFKKYEVFDDFYYSSQNLLGNAIANFFVDNKKRLWIATTFKGLCFYDERSNQFISYRNDPMQASTPSSNQYVNIFQDKQGFLWLGSEGYGVDYFHPDQNFLQLIAPLAQHESLLPSLWSRAMTEDKDGNLWLAWGGALTRQNQKEGSFTIWKNVRNKPKQIHYNSIRSLLCDDHGDIWIGTADGVNRYRNASGKMDFFEEKDSLPHSFYWCIFQDSKKTIWFGNRGNLYYLDTTDRKIHTVANHTVLSKFNNQGVRCIVEDSKHRLWFGMNGSGLTMYDPRTQIAKQWKRTGTNDSTLLDNVITSIAEDRDGIIWASSYIGLIAYDARSDKFVQYTSKSGLPSVKTSCLAVDGKNRLWIGSTSGLLMLDASRRHFRTFDMEDGLPTLEFNDQPAYKMKDGRFVFPSLKGFVAFNPNDYRETMRPPQLYLSAIKIHNVDLRKSNYEELEGLELRHNQNFFSIELSALNYANPQQTWYAYKLEPFDKDWIYTQQRVVNYTNVPGGRYNFHYKATADPNNWNVPEKKLTVNIGTAFYKTVWFWPLVILALASLSFWAYTRRIQERQRIYSLQNKAQMLEKEKALVHYESLKQQLNPHFLFNSLTSLSSLIETDPRVARKFLDQMSKIYRYILASRDSELVPLIEDIKLAEVYAQLQQTRFQDGLKVNVDVEEKDYKRKIVPVTVQNLMENAIKHNIIDVDSPLVIDIFTENGHLVVRNNLQKKNFVQTSNKQGLANMRSLYHYLDRREMIIQEDAKFFTVKIPLI